MGSDAFGNRYYENRVDYPYGQHRWVEPADIHNFDSTHVPPEWHGWMMSVNDATPQLEAEYMEEKLSHTKKGEISHAPFQTNVGHQEPIFNFHGMHNQSTIRSRGYGIGNNIVGLPPGAPDAYYTQPGSPYNDASIRKFKMQGDLGNNRPYKNDLWKSRLMTAEEKDAKANANRKAIEQGYEAAKASKPMSARERAMLARGGSISK